MWRALALLAVVPVAAACSGRDALRAEQLLQQARAAESSVSSATYSAHLTVTSKGQQMSVVLTGGGYSKGPHAGDMVMNLKLSAPVALPFDSIEVARVGGTAWLSMGGRRQSLPAGALDGTSGADPSASPFGAFDFTRYVKDVAVDGGEVLNGRAVTKITGVLDTAAMVKGLAALGQAGSSAGLPDLGGTVGDTRVVVYVDDATHLLTAALADLSLHADGETVSMHMDLAVTGVDQPVALPSA